MMKQIIFYFILFSYANLMIAQNVGINASGAVPHSSAMLDIDVSSLGATAKKGFLMPRIALTSVTDITTIPSPTTSLLVYNTTAASTGTSAVFPGFYYWDGTIWIAIAGSGGKDWSLVGNAGTNPPSVGYGSIVDNNFLGTTDAKDLTFATNGYERMRIRTDNNSQLRIGMGTAFTVNLNAGSTPSLLHLHDWGNTSNDFAILNLSSGTTASGNRTGVINFAATTATNERRAASIESYLTAASATNVSADMRFFTNDNNSFAERMRILSNGNVGIANVSPTEKLDVTGNVRFSGDLRPNNLPGSIGYVLVSQGANTAPQWQSPSSVLKAYSTFATRTTINSTTWIDVGGLSQTITTTGPAIFIITTYGSLEIISSTYYQAGAEIRILQNGVLVPNAYQTHDWFDEATSIGTINHWSFQTLVTVATAGTYTFKVQAHKYLTTFDNFYAGGNTTAPVASQNQGAMIIQQFDQ